MKKIYFAQLQPTGTTDMDGNICEWQWAEKSKAEYGAEWNGDVQGYVENLIENVNGDEGHKVLSLGNTTVHNFPVGALILLHDGVPGEIYWADDGEDLISIPEYADAHGKSRVTAAQYAREGKLQTARKIGRNYVVDEDEPWPEDGRRGTAMGGVL